MYPSNFPLRSLALAVVATTALGGCASFSADGGLDAVQAGAREHIPQDVVWTRDDAARAEVQARVDALLEQPLTADAAVQVALLNNPGLQAALESLALAEASRVTAGRLPNPGFSIARLTRGSEVEWERSLHLNLAMLLTMPMRADIERRLFEQTRQRLVIDVLQRAADARKAWLAAVAARQSAEYQRQAMEAAEAGAELARRMAQAGNWSKLKQAREQAFYADAALALARAEQVKAQTRERLIRLLGLDDGARVKLPDRLPALPESLPPMRDVEQQAMASRIDLRIAKQQAETLAKNLGLTRRTRLVNVLELGVINNGSNEEPQQRGYEISFELPLFDWGQSRVVAAEARYRQALERARETAVNARSEVREAYAMQRGQYAVARHLVDEVVPLKQRISEENLLRYNGMLISVFELLADARAQIASVNAAIDAQRDFWIADADLRMALAGKPELRSVAPVSSAPADAAGGH